MDEACLWVLEPWPVAPPTIFPGFLPFGPGSSDVRFSKDSEGFDDQGLAEGLGLLGNDLFVAEAGILGGGMSVTWVTDPLCSSSTCCEEIEAFEELLRHPRLNLRRRDEP